MILSLILIFLLLGIYGWLSAIEFAISLLRLLPSSTATRHSLRLFSPRWEAANVFLLLGLGGFAIFFNGSLATVILATLPFLAAGAVALTLRLGLIFLLTYGKYRTGLRWSNIFFAVTSFAVPLCLGAIGIRLLTGHHLWQTLGGWALIVSLAFGLLAMAMAYIYYSIGLTPHGRIQILSRWLNALFCISVALVLQQLILARQPHLLATPFAGFVLLIAFVVLWQAMLWYSARDRYMWWYLSLVGIGSPVLLALANHPYLMYPQVSLKDAYSAANYHWLAALGLYLVLPLLLAGFGALTWRLMHPKVKPSRRAKLKADFKRLKARR